MTTYGQRYAHPPPPQPPELPEGVDPTPRWPAWYAPVGFVGGFAATLVVFALVALPLGALGVDLEDDSSALTVVGTIVQALILAGTAVWLASRVARPRAWHFGLRRAPLWPTVGWAVLGMVSFYAFAIAYSVAVQPPQDSQTVVEELGAGESTLALVVAGFVVIVVAPFAEEFFFRGFFYRALRSRMRIAWAALLDGLLFGVIHYTGPETLEILPILVVLGIVFCLVYERTGTLYAPIALHAVNNTIAYASSVEGEPGSGTVAAALGLSTVAACFVLPRLSARGAPRRA
jgi:uncharacterized protein